MKKLLFALSLIVIVCLFALSVSAVEIDGIDYTLKGTEAEVNTGNQDCGLTTVVIPETFTYNEVTYTVTVINGSAFRNNKTVVSITTPSTIRAIGEHAFREMAALERITLNASAEFKYFENAEVYGCKKLQYADLRGMVGLVDMGNSGTYDHTFTNCSALTEVYLPNTVLNIGLSVFNGCSSLSQIDLPDNLTTIESNAFTGCALETVSIPNTVTYIGDYAFQSCNSLKEMNIPVGVTYLGCNNFQYSDVTKVIIPSTVAAAGKDMFNNVWTLETVVIGNADVSQYNGTFFTSCGPLNYVFYAGNDATVLTSKYSAFSAHQLVSYENYLKDIRNPEFTGYEGKVLVYGVKTCKSCGDVDTSEHGFIFDDFLSKMYMGAECASCGAKTVSETVDSIFVDLGYSTFEINGQCSILQGFKINREAMEFYNAQLEEQAISEIGVVAVASFRGYTTAFDENGEARDGVTNFALVVTTEMLEIKVIGLNAEGTLTNGSSVLDAKLHLCAYVKAGDKTYYISEDYVGEQLDNAVSYNDKAEK